MRIILILLLFPLLTFGQPPNNVWFLDNNGTDQIGNNDGTVAGGGAYTTTWKVQGTHSFYSASDNDMFNTLSSIDIGTTGWLFIKGEARIDGSPSYPVLIANGNGSGSRFYIFIDRATGRLFFRTHDGATTNDAISTNAAVPTSSPFQYGALVNLSAGYVSLFIDNVEVTGSDSTIHTTWLKNSIITIGAEGNGGGTIFGGEDNVQLYKRFVGSGERTLLYNNRANDYWLGQTVGAITSRERPSEIIYYNTIRDIAAYVGDEYPVPPVTTWDILFSQDFTTSTNSTSGRYQFDKIALDFDLDYTGWDTNIRIVDSNDVNGSPSRMLRVDFPNGTWIYYHGCEFTSWIQPEGPDYDGTDIFVSCNIKIKTGFQFNQGIKFIGLDMHSSVDYEPGGAPPSGAQGSHGHYVWQGQGMGRFYDYWHTGTAAPFYGWGDFVYYRFETGKWYNIVQRFVRNTIGQSDGYHEMFVNGRFVARYDNIKWSERDTVGFNKLRMSFFMGGGESFAAERDEYLLVDDIEVFTDPLLAEVRWEPDELLVPPGKFGTFNERTPTTYTATSGNVRNASYPNNYAGYTFEVHKIHANPGKTITVTPTLVKLGSSDYVVVIDGDSPLDLYGNLLHAPYGDWAVTTTVTNGAPFTSTGNDVTIVLATDNNNNSAPTGLSFSFAYTINP